jgi:hypothetical protein
VRVTWRESASLAGQLCYSKSEYGFRFEVSNPADLKRRSADLEFSSVSIDTLQIEVDTHTGDALYVWGYEPYLGWQKSRIAPPDSQTGTVTLDPGEPFDPGVSYTLPARDWVRAHDPDSGWVRISAPGADTGDWHIEIADGTVLGGSGEELRSIHLRPSFED